MTVLTLPNAVQLAHSVRAKALVFEDPRSRALLARIEQVAPSGATVLITGETGTGKEIVARHIHDLSLRARSPFVAVNCAAFSETLVESELFGHERGAFTGAERAKAGWFEAAHGGSLFLDEVGDLSLATQVRLLRVLQESEVVRLGARQPIPIDVRLIAATNVDLEQAIEAGHFREDLYYRLHVTTLRLLPLRERPLDIPPLAAHFVGIYGKRVGRPEMLLAGDALERLVEHPWPGNIRELENAIHHATLVCGADLIRAEHLQMMPARRKLRASIAAPAAQPAAPEQALEESLRAMFETEQTDLYERIEEVVFRTAYAFCDRNQLQTARLLGISRNIVRGRLAQFGHLRASPRQTALARLEAPRGRTAEARVVRVGYQGFGMLSLVKAHGTLDAELASQNVSVEWLEFPAGPELLAAFQAGTIDFGNVGECPPVVAQAADVPFVYVAAAAPSPEGEAIIVHADSELRCVADLRGKRVGLNAGANVHYLLIRALEEAKLDYQAIHLSFGPPDHTLRQFQEREIDAWAIWDPLLASVQQSIPTRVLRDARGLTQNAAYYVAHRAFAEDHAPIVHVLMRHVQEVSRLVRTNPERALLQLTRELRLPRDGLALALSRQGETSPVTDELLLAQQSIADTLHRLQLIPRPISVADARWTPLLAG